MNLGMVTDTMYRVVRMEALMCLCAATALSACLTPADAEYWDAVRPRYEVRLLSGDRFYTSGDTVRIEVHHIEGDTIFLGASLYYADSDGPIRIVNDVIKRSAPGDGSASISLTPLVPGDVYIVSVPLLEFADLFRWHTRWTVGLLPRWNYAGFLELVAGVERVRFTARGSDPVVGEPPDGNGTVDSSRR